MREVSAAEDQEEFFEAAPEGDPAGATVAFPSQVAAQASEVTDELRDGHVVLGAFADPGQDFDPGGGNDILGEFIR